jgi:ABC-type Zn uptake system ZnuABC Zn-binding protein ZnuA
VSYFNQGYALKTPQPWLHKQDEQLSEAFLQRLQQLLKRHDNKEKLLERLDQAMLDVINPTTLLIDL